MRSAGRIFVATEDPAVPAQLALARAAEAVGLEGIWIHGPATGHGDSYATAAAAAIAAVTTDLRIGVVLTLAAREDILRLAEDVVVLDHCSSGRAELWLHPPAGSGAAWSTRAELLVTNLRSCTVDGRQITVTPGPLQPTVPVSGERFLRVGPAEAQAALDATGNPDSLGPTVEKLRAAIEQSDAQDVTFTVDDEAAAATIASLLAPLLRANDDEVPDLVLDTLKFRSAARVFSA